MPLFSYDPLQYLDSIRLAKIHPGMLDDPVVKITLIPTRLSSELQYKALSYTWGDQSDRLVISINAGDLETSATSFAELSITRNCYNALCQLRKLDRAEVTWIDAICINQEDLAERSSQVRIMGQIFALAQQVIAYIGEETTESRIAFDELAEADKTFSSIGKFERPKLSHEVVQGLDHILQRSWFSRIWVIQEIANAQFAEFMCGSQTASIYALYYAIFGYSENNRVTESYLPYVLGAHRDSFSQNQKAHIALWHLLARTRRCLSSDPRDRIFALIPLIGPERQEVEALVDYDQPVEKVFTDFAKYMTPFLGPWLFLAVRHPHGLEMPSWVPDWSQNNAISSKWSIFGTIISNLENYHDLGSVFLENEKPYENIYTIAARSCSHQACAGRHPVLCVRGVRHSTIVKEGATFNLSDRENTKSIFRELFEMIPKQPDVQIQDCEMGKLSPLFRIDEVNAELVKEVTIDDIGHILTRGGLGVYSGSDEAMAIEMMEENMLEIEESVHNCKLFRTSNGTVGVSPHYSREGDVVCVFRGSLSPSLLRRRTDGDWTMISGDMYLSGEIREIVRETKTLDEFIDKRQDEEETFSIW